MSTTSFKAESLIQESDSDFKVHSSVYTDTAIFEKEMQVLFESSWCYVAHESEIRLQPLEESRSSSVEVMTKKYM
jgi:hypothetical protein